MNIKVNVGAPSKCFQLWALDAPRNGSKSELKVVRAGTLNGARASPTVTWHRCVPASSSQSIESRFSDISHYTHGNM